MLRVVRTAFMLSVLTGAGALPALASPVETFIGHARYEADRQHSETAGDPQVFVADANAPAAGGAQGIAHIQGFRRARLVDDQSLPLYNAQGSGLSLSLGRWLGAGGSAESVAGVDGGGNARHFKFTGLVPFGVYSIFIGHVSGNDIAYVPYAEVTNSLTASIDGFIDKTATATNQLQDGDVLTLVYHSDGQAHGQSRGDIGVTAHEQLILSVTGESERQPAETPAPATPAASPLPEDGADGDVFVPSATTPMPAATTPAPAVSPNAQPANIDDEPTF